jgi:dolichyl-phosphate-mannose--protein O-mannosyl transferase
MIEIFLISFLLLGIYFFLKDKHTISAFFLGCAFAVKWSALFMIAPMLIMIGFKDLNYNDLKTMLKFGVIILTVYFATFIPYMFVTSNYKISFFEIFSLPIRMYELQKMVPTEHPYKSEWYTWPLMLRPMWLEFKILAADPFVSQGVMLLANPLQIFLGALSVIYLTLFWKKQNREIQKLLILFFSAWLIWGISPRKLTFFYYFFPSAVLYSFFIPEAMRRILPEKSQKISFGILVISSFVLFLFFYPVIAGTPITGEMRTSLMWLSSWN